VDGRDCSADDAAERKRQALEGRWQRKLDERRQEQERRQEERQQAADPSQDIGAFLRRFEAIDGRIQQGLTDARNAALSRADLKKQLDALAAEVVLMQKELAAATLFLPPYDIRQASDKIAAAGNAIEQARVDLAPRRKFAFGSRSKLKTATKSAEDLSGNNAESTEKNAGKIGPTDPGNEEKNVDKDATSERAQKPRAAEALLASMSLESTEVVVEKRKGEQVNVAEENDVRGDQDVRIRELEDCTVKLLKPTGAVRFLHMKRCKVYIGPVAGSCFFENCEDCEFMIASRQIRIHDTKRCDFYLHVLSRPIFEHCSELRFAPYGLTYEGLEDQLQTAGLNVPRAVDMWKDVDDFRWLRQQQSPNWCILDEAERKSVSLS